MPYYARRSWAPRGYYRRFWRNRGFGGRGYFGRRYGRYSGSAGTLRQFGRSTRYPRPGGTQESSVLRAGHVGPFPDKMKFHLSVQQTLSYSTLIGSFLLRLNDLSDPFGAGGTKRPVGFTQLAAIYDKYRVHSAKVRVRAAPMDTDTLTADNVVPHHIIMSEGSDPSFTVTTSAQFDSLGARQNARSILVSIGTGGAISAQPNSQFGSVIEKYISMAEVGGDTRTQYSTSDDTSAAFGSSPIDLRCGYIAVQALPNGTASPVAQGYLIVQIDFYGEAFDANQLLESEPAEALTEEQLAAKKSEWNLLEHMQAAAAELGSMV